MRMFRKWLTAVLGTAVLAGGSLLATPGAASADPQEAIGHETRPGQPYRGNPEPDRDWLGSYLVNGQQVWCVQFALTAPDSGEEYEPGDELKSHAERGNAFACVAAVADVGATRDPLVLRR
ncbi:hypothetical protein AB0L88_45070 [Saccharopolyspora shandongensis]|uniref:hypothetical protein n=1 Tax=Saccharopolyspora shandongensis TaxID=418495 RepID=UPI003430ACEB